MSRYVEKRPHYTIELRAETAGREPKVTYYNGCERKLGKPRIWRINIHAWVENDTQAGEEVISYTTQHPVFVREVSKEVSQHLKTRMLERGWDRYSHVLITCYVIEPRR